jgi:hypothetical protein
MLWLTMAEPTSITKQQMARPQQPLDTFVRQHSLDACADNDPLPH